MLYAIFGNVVGGGLPSDQPLSKPFLRKSQALEMSRELTRIMYSSLLSGSCPKPFWILFLPPVPCCEEQEKAAVLQEELKLAQCSTIKAKLQSLPHLCSAAWRYQRGCFWQTPRPYLQDPSEALKNSTLKEEVLKGSGWFLARTFAAVRALSKPQACEST